MYEYIVFYAWWMVRVWCIHISVQMCIPTCVHAHM